MKIFKWLKIFRHNVQILLYHRVADVTSDPQKLCVKQENFYEQIKFISKNYHIQQLAKIKTKCECNGNERMDHRMPFSTVSLFQI